MRAGSLRHTVTIQQKVISGTGDRGQTLYTWNNYASVPAMIEELGGRRLELARQLVASATHQITIRYFDGLAVGNRLLDETGRVYNIGAIQDKLLLHFTQELTCTSEEIGA